jgi:transposase InsO family protein
MHVSSEIEHAPYAYMSQKVVSVNPNSTPRSKPRWERRLPKQYVLAAIPTPQSLSVKVEIQTTDTGELFSSPALIDCGASGRFLSKKFVERNKLTSRTLSRPIPVYNVDGTLNEGGAITEVVDLILRYEGHTERATFAVTNLGRQDVILGFTWLEEHNPEIDWKTRKVVMSRCPAKCHLCRSEERREKREAVEQRRVEEQLRRLRERRGGERWKECVQTEEEEEVEKGEMAEEGDRVFYVQLPPEAEFIRATSTFSTRLAEAAHTTGGKDPIPPHLTAFEDVFSKTAFDSLPERRVWDHAIELIPDAKASNCKIYPLSPKEQGELDGFLEENLKTGRIRPSKSPMASPVFFVKKKDGSLRLVQDYRALNAMTIRNRYPLPLISELIHQLREAKFFTKLDVRWGYNNVRIKEGDEWKAAFRTNRGLFEPLVMFFGLTNSPATFQTMMNDLFQDLIARGVVCVYLDDILIYTKTLEEHRTITLEVLARLRAYKLYLKPEKCEFERTKVEYLGLVISAGSVEMDPIKVAGVAEWPVPENRKEVQSFLGFVNFYRRFVQDFSKVARPLFELTKKDILWRWGREEQEAFDQLRHKITSTPILKAPEDNKAFRLEADSSGVATGAVLSQQTDDGRWHPVAFYSKSLNATERNYEIYDKELLAIIRAVEEWRYLLEGAQFPFEIWTDHKNLQYFRTAQKLNRRQARWSLFLSQFDYSLHHRPGRSMGRADALSCRPDHGSGQHDNENVVLLKPELFEIRAMEGVELTGEERGLLAEVRKGMEEEGSFEKGVKEAWERLRKGTSEGRADSDWTEEEGVLYFRSKIYVPDVQDLRQRIVALHHDTLMSGHPGRWKTTELVARNFWWPQMTRYIGRYTSTCDLCLRTKIRRQAPHGELQPLQIPEARWETISVDFIVELPEAHGFDAVMCVVDSVSKRAHFVPTHTTITSLGTARLFLNHAWKLHGLPRSVVSDRGPQFVSEFTKELYRLLGIQLASSTAYHPQTDGQTERVNQELEQYLRLFVNERQDNWDELLPMAEFQYNNRVHSSTRQSPFMLDTGMHPRMGFEPRQIPSKLETVNDFKARMSDALEEGKAALRKAKEDMAKYYDRRRQPTPSLNKGDKVFLDASDISTTRPSNKLSHRYLGPFPIEEKIGKNAYRLKLPLSMKRLHPVFNVVKLVPAPDDPIIGRKRNTHPPPTLIDEEGEEHYEVESVLDSRLIRGKLHFLVKWKGYGYEENRWIPENDLHAPDLLQEFYTRHPGAPRRLPTGTLTSRRRQHTEGVM